LLSSETESVVKKFEEEYDEDEDYEEEEQNQETPVLRNRFTADTPDHGNGAVGKKEEFTPTSRRKLTSHDDEVKEVETKKNKGVVSKTWATIVWSIKLMVKLIMLWLFVCAVYYIYNNHLVSTDPINKMQESIQKAANDASETIDLK